MRARDVGAVQLAARSAATVSSAPTKSPSGLAARGQIWPLSRWVCASTNSGRTIAPRQRQARRRRRSELRPAGAMARDAALPRSGDRPREIRRGRWRRSRRRARARNARRRAAQSAARRRSQEPADLTSRGSGRCRASGAATGARRAVSSRKIAMPVTEISRQRGEHARNVEPIARFDDAKGETRALARRARRDFRDDRADQREAAADAQAAEEIGQRRGQRAATATAASARRGRAGRDRGGCGRPRRGRARCWRESGRTRRGTRRPAPPAGAQIDQQQRRDRDDRRHLQDHRERKERAFDDAPLREQRARAATPPTVAAISASKVMRQRHQERAGQGPPVLDQRRHDQARRRQDDGRDVLDADDRFPAQASRGRTPASAST